MKDHAAQVVSDEDFATRAERWPKETPDTKEAYFIRDIFDGDYLYIFLISRCLIMRLLKSYLGLFSSKAAAETAVRWIPRGDWGCAADPSGRSVSIHNAAYSE